ncbi:AAA family ATPase [Mucilaginibacter sp. 21P]|uniref:AAA family ATPase n=1 Tax=Mucilaginibacter sp. 21P TaxID=2778902 RepID=UPI001C57220D|nr:AAA family ATPase [Mucilaginibacter sp. 21P]QXV63996.1 AAA family ATPase [Mucilaginibacter sp. 21P]
MAKTLMLAVAGSGKTTLLVDRLCADRRTLILTYTNTNERNLRSAIIKRFGYHPKNISLFTYYTFLYSFCYRPLLSLKMGSAGINWLPNPDRFAKGDDQLVDRYGRLYSNRIALTLKRKNVLSEVKTRLERYFDQIFIDEVQDFAGNDFNFLDTLVSASLEQLFVGDFFQHTYDTSRDGNVNGTLHDDLQRYVARFESLGLRLDKKTLSKSHRCNPEICAFVEEQLGITIGSHRSGGSSIIHISSAADAAVLFRDNSVVKLFYQAHYHYDCYSKNWGESKGEDRYQDVCVVMNGKTWKSFQDGELKGLPSQTRSKLYVALTRTKGNLYLLPESLLKQFKKK